MRAAYADRVARLDDWLVAGLAVVLGATMGILVTTTSIGAGAIGVTVLLFLYPRLEGHWYLGSVDWALLAALLTGPPPGIAVGSALVGRIPDVAVRKALAVILVVVGVRVML
jgi:uncharacterized membrane protein YfcA